MLSNNAFSFSNGSWIILSDALDSWHFSNLNKFYASHNTIFENFKGSPLAIQTCFISLKWKLFLLVIHKWLLTFKCLTTYTYTNPLRLSVINVWEWKSSSSFINVGPLKYYGKGCSYFQYYHFLYILAYTLFALELNIELD